jgi:chlorobactene glucosyltransferase
MELLVLVALIFLFTMTVFNFFSAFRLSHKFKSADLRHPFVSVLVPARNEAHHLVHLIPSLLKSDYPNFEIIILDDESSDQTFQIAEKLLSGSLVSSQVIKGQAWNQSHGISGKNFACHQLSQVARGEILVFCDADVMISKTALSQTVQLILQNPSASGVSGLLQLKTSSFLQSLVLPWILQIPLMMTLPLRFAWQMPFKSMQMANGQWLAIWKESYKKMGGHLAVGTSVVEDVQIARRLLDFSLGGMIPVLSAKELSVSMYADWKSMVQGFSKNLISIYGGHPVAFLAVLMALNLVFFCPLMMADELLRALSLLIILSLRILCGLAFGNSVTRSILSGLLTWPSLVILNGFAVLILKNYFLKNTQWKGRSISFPESSV